MSANRLLVVSSWALVFLALACSGGPVLVRGNRFQDVFPKDRDDRTIVVTSEKPGLAMASLRKGENELASFSITDLSADEEARAKFKSPTSLVSGYPLLPRGEAGSAILVGNRFQVQVISKLDSFNEQDRKDWLMRFDLDALSDIY